LVSSSLEELPLLFKDYFFATGNLIAVMDEKYFHDESWNQSLLIRVRCQILQKITVVEIKHVFVSRNIVEHFRQFS